MSRYINNDTQGIMGITLSQLGLMIAAAFLLVVIYTLLFNTAYQQQQQMNQIAEHFSTTCAMVDNTWYETKKEITPSKEYKKYHISLSPSSIKVSISSEKNTFTRKALLIQPWIKSSSDEWINSDQLHQVLLDRFGDKGTKNDPVKNMSSVRSYLSQIYNKSLTQYTFDPLVIDTSSAVSIEKTIIYFDENQNHIWEKNEQVNEYILLYQCNT